MQLIKFTFIVSFCLFITAGFAQDLNTDLDMGLNGKVVSITGTEYKISDAADPTKDETRRFEYTFNSSHNITKNELFDSRNRTLYRATYQYNSLGLLTQENIINNMIKEKSTRKRYTYNKNNQISKTTIYNSKGALLRTFNHEYNSDDELIAVKAYDAKNKLLDDECITYTYNAFGYRDKELSGNKKILFTYNKQGYCVKKEEYIDEVLKYITEYQRDKAGSITRESTVTVGANNEHSIPVDIDYIYDDMGNWISMRESMEDKTFALTIRNIEYEEITDKRYLPD